MFSITGRESACNTMNGAANTTIGCDVQGTVTAGHCAV
jgi:hypothetical protein